MVPLFVLDLVMICAILMLRALGCAFCVGNRDGVRRVVGFRVSHHSGRISEHHCTGASLSRLTASVSTWGAALCLILSV